MDFKKGIAYVGLCDVVGGRMWFCVSPVKKESEYFWTKKKCEKFVRDSFCHGISTGYVGIIETFYLIRQLWKLQFCL